MKMDRYGKTGAAIAVLASALCLASLASCGKNAAAGGAATRPAGSSQGSAAFGRHQGLIPVQAATVQVGDLVASRGTSGQVVPDTQSQVAAQVAGVVKSTPRQVGDWVQAGDDVVQLDDAQFKLAVDSAQAALNNAKLNLEIGLYNEKQANPKLVIDVQSAQSALEGAQKNYEAQKALYALGGTSASQLDTARTQLSQAQSGLEGAKTALDQNQKSGEQNIAQLRVAVDQAQIQFQQAKLNLQYTAIRAPFAGQVSALNVNPGMYVGLNTPAFTLVSSRREIDFSVPPSDAAALRIGTVMRFTHDGKDYPIRVSQTPSAPIQGMVPMVASIGAASDLPFGSVGTVSYTLSMAHGALVPVAALSTLENRNYVFTIENGKTVRKYVTIIAEAGITAAVSGLDSAATVVLNPPPGLLEGSQVQASMVRDPAATATSQTAGNS
ncbi:MAG TPA: HlyD family efflux transporter periplasmic adaptor subunit [Rectinemataceae bacterium]|nr:HlyD family efflux transporter periplasmic adaptor subunit [Rectinemataceae bacterium]